mmetsp:Transcript_16105/g.18057  ORF Transcript_16105/g.18057 Transcript_16105/m.18057 type:complete len:235 (-) Transcript_16105:267-971(-)
MTTKKEDKAVQRLLTVPQNHHRNKRNNRIIMDRKHSKNKKNKNKYFNRRNSNKFYTHRKSKKNKNNTSPQYRIKQDRKRQKVNYSTYESDSNSSIDYKDPSLEYYLSICDGDCCNNKQPIMISGLQKILDNLEEKYPDGRGDEVGHNITRMTIDDDNDGSYIEALLSKPPTTTIKYIFEGIDMVQRDEQRSIKMSSYFSFTDTEVSTNILTRCDILHKMLVFSLIMKVQQFFKK